MIFFLGETPASENQQRTRCIVHQKILFRFRCKDQSRNSERVVCLSLLRFRIWSLLWKRTGIIWCVLKWSCIDSGVVDVAVLQNSTRFFLKIQGPVLVNSVAMSTPPVDRNHVSFQREHVKCKSRAWYHPFANSYCADVSESKGDVESASSPRSEPTRL